MVKEAVIYCRVSTNLQIGDNHVTMELQEKRGQEFAARTGYTVIKTCSDAGISGKSRKNRKGLNEALSLLKKDDALIVFNLSRLARNTRETLEIFEEIQKKKAHLLSVTENINSADAVGRLWITLLSSLAQFERETTAERVSKAMEYKKQKGERVGRIPFGYQLSNGKGSLLVENPEEQRIIRLIFDKRATLDDKGKPKSYRKIADELNAEKVPAGKTAKQWYPTSCERILKRKPIVIVPQVEEQDLEPNEDDIHRLLASTLADFEQNREEDNEDDNEDNEDDDNQDDQEDYQNEDDDNQDPETEDRYENGDIEEDPEPEDNNQDEGQEDQNQGENQEEIDDPPANEDNQAHENEDDNQDENQDETNNQAQTFDLTQTISLLQRAINEKWPQEQIDAIRSLLTPALGLTPQTQTQKVTKPNIRKEAPLVVDKSPPTVTPTVPKAKISKAVAKNNPAPEASPIPNPIPKALPNPVPKSVPKPASTQVVTKGTQPLKKPAQKASPVPNAIPKSIPKTAEGKPLIENKGPVKNTRPPVPKEVPKSIARAPTMAQPIVQKNSMSKVETKPTIGNRDTQNVPKRIPR